MNNRKFFLLMAMVFISPHLNDSLGMVLGAIFMLFYSLSVLLNPQTNAKVE